MAPAPIQSTSPQRLGRSSTTAKRRGNRMVEDTHQFDLQSIIHHALHLASAPPTMASLLFEGLNQHGISTASLLAKAVEDSPSLANLDSVPPTMRNYLARAFGMVRMTMNILHAYVVNAIWVVQI